ncbi:MAG: DNA-directed RNA polymerase subunit L [Methanotrichaceae archaeon]
MNIKILEKTEDEVRVEFEDESHTLLNLLKTELLADDRVLLATYNTKFPTVTKPVFYLKTKNANPIELLNEAASKIANLCGEFKNRFEFTLE